MNKTKNEASIERVPQPVKMTEESHSVLKISPLEMIEHEARAETARLGDLMAEVARLQSQNKKEQASAEVALTAALLGKLRYVQEAIAPLLAVSPEDTVLAAPFSYTGQERAELTVSVMVAGVQRAWVKVLVEVSPVDVALVVALRGRADELASDYERLLNIRSSIGRAYTIKTAQLLRMLTAGTASGQFVEAICADVAQASGLTSMVEKYSSKLLK